MSDPARWARLKGLFHSFIDLPAPERAPRLEALRTGDPEIAKELASLLEAHEKTGDPLAALSGLASSLAPDDEDIPTFADGAILGRYRIVERVGRGGMGEVYLAHDEALGIPVAIKTLLPIHASNPAAVARFRKEVILARTVTHPNVCRIYDVGIHESEGRSIPFLTMELIRGETLSAFLSRKGRLPPAEVLPLLRQMAEGLQAAHTAGIVHRDFKSGNVLLEPQDAGLRAVITDFGLARAIEENAAQRISSTALAGTPAYMAPEQIQGGRIGPATDIYGLGVVLYELLTGTLPFTGPTPFAAAVRRLVDPAPLIRLPDVDAVWQSVVKRCLARDPGERFARATEVVEALEGLAIPASGGPRSAMLPWTRSTFVGRRQETAEILGLLGENRLVCLTGIAGCGKTRLAIEVAENAHGFEARFVDLAPVRAAAEVAGAVALCLGITEGPSRPLVETLGAAFAANRMLVVLDNCEHVVQGVRDLLAALLSQPTETVVLATSREPIDHPAEVVVKLAPLSLPKPGDPHDVDGSEAVRLFVARATSARPDFRLSPTNVAAVAKLVTALDGIPLALELAAARVKVMPVEEILRRLEDRFRILATSDPEATPRHRTLEAAMDWSWDQLPEAERALLRRMSVFAGGLSLHAVEHVCAGTPVEAHGILDLLEQLIDRSLCVYAERAGEAGYRLLETVRAYGLRKLRQAGEEAPVRSRHVDFHGALVAEAPLALRGADQALWLARLSLCHHDLSAAIDTSLRGPDAGARGLSIATAVASYWEIRGHLTEGRERLRAVLESPAGKVRRTERAGALRAAGILARRQADAAAARSLIEEALAIFREASHPLGIASALHDLGSLSADRGDCAAAEKLFVEGLDARRAFGDRHGAATSLLSLGILAMEQGHQGRAADLYEESRQLFQDVGDRRGVANALNNLAIVAYVGGDPARSRALHEEALAVRRELGERRGTAASLDNLGILANEMGDHALARAYKEESLGIVKELGDSRGVALALASLGDTARTRGDWAEAHGRYAQSLRFCRRAGSQRVAILALEGFGLLALEASRWVRAVTLLGAAIELRERLGSQLSGNTLATREECLRAAREALGVPLYGSLFEQGRKMSFERAIEYALGGGE